MKLVKQMRLKRGMSVADLVNEMKMCGVLGAGRTGRAAELVTRMFSNPDFTVFLTLAGPLVPGGLKGIICDLLRREYVNVVVTTGANLVHDMVEALGFRHSIGTFWARDERLRAKNIGRIGDIYIEQAAFQRLEKWIYDILLGIPPERRQSLSFTDILFEMGKQISDPESILAIAARKDVPIICPSFLDSIAGFHLWMFGQDKKIGINPLRDLTILMDKVYEAKKVGVLILGGGVPKHFALFANTFREGVDSAVQITMDRPEHGSLSGASLEEAISWGKIKPEGESVTIIGDATIIFPVIIAAALSSLP